MDTKTLCLAVLQSGPASGYEIKKTLETAPYSHFQDTSFGALYPALARLAAEGAIEASELAQEKRPDKKVYSLTGVGRARLVEALMQTPPPDKYRSDFLLVLFLADLLPPEHVMALVEARIGELERDVERMRACDLHEHSPAQRFVHAFGQAYYEFASGWLRANRDRLAQELLAAREAAPAGAHALDAPADKRVNAAR